MTQKYINKINRLSTFYILLKRLFFRYKYCHSRFQPYNLASPAISGVDAHKTDVGWGSLRTVLSVYLFREVTPNQMSFIKQCRLHFCLMSLIGLAPFTGFYANPIKIRVYAPFIVYNLFLIVLLQILSFNYVNQLLATYENNANIVSILLIAQFAYLVLLSTSFALVLLSTIIMAPLHNNLMNKFEVFHESVCALNPKDKSSSLINQLVIESFVFNFIWIATLFHLQLCLGTGSVIDAIVNSFMMTVVTTFVFHIRLITNLLGSDLKTIRQLFEQNVTGQRRLMPNDPVFLLFEEFISVKKLLESVFGTTLALCSVFDLVILVVDLYMFTMIFIVLENSMLGLAEGSVGHVFPFVSKKAMLASASEQIAKEVIVMRKCIYNNV